jgi:non-heme chloroperoxidase
MDHYADDLAQLIEHLDLEDAMLVGFSTGGGEVARYVGRHGTRRVAKLALISAVPPLMVKTAANPDGSPMEVFDDLRTASIADRSKLYHELAAGPFFGFNRPGATPSQGMIDSFWLQGMMSGHKNAYDCIKAFSETDFTEDLKRFDKPTLVIHGDDDQIVPIGASAHVAAKLIPQCDARRLSGGATWSCRYAQAPAQRRPPRVRQVLNQGGTCAISARAPPTAGMQRDAACRTQRCKGEHS